MKKLLQNKKEISFIIFIFIFTALLLSASKLFSFYQINKMNEIIADIYNHPLKVSNAALNVKLEAYKIHSSMRVIVFSSSNEEIDKIAQEIDKHEKHLYENLSIIEKEILGDEGKKLQLQTKELLKKWKPVRESIIELVKNNKKIEAVDKIQNNCEFNALKIEDSVVKLYNYAKFKAEEFRKNSDETSNKLRTINFFSFVILLVLLFVFALYVVRRVERYIRRNKHLTSVLTVIKHVNQLIIREKDSLKLISKSCRVLASNHVYSSVFIVSVDENGEIEHIVGSDDSDEFLKFKEKIYLGWRPNCMEKNRGENEFYSYKASSFDNCMECPLSGKYLHNCALNIALKHDEKIHGYLVVTLDEKYIDNEEELALLSEIAGDIAYAFHNTKVEKNLKDSQEQLSLILEGANDGIWDWDLVNDKVYFSPRWKEILGYKDNELENTVDVWQSRLHPEDRENTLLAVKESQEGKSKFFKIIHRLKHKDGSWVCIEGRGRTVYDENNKAIRMLGTHTDITKDKKIEEETLYLKELYDNIIDSVENFIFAKDTEFNYVACNKAFASFTGKSKDEIVGNSDYEIFSKDVADMFRDYDEKMLESKKSQLNFEWVIHADGRKMYLQTLKAPLYNSKGEIFGLVGNSADLTELNKMEEALIQSEKKFKLLMHQSPSIIEIYDLDGKQIDVNRSYEELWGFDKSLTINKFNIFKSEEVKRSGLLEYVKRAYAGEAVSVPSYYKYDSRGETEAQGKGRTRWLSTKVYPLKNSNNEVENIVITHEDVTQKQESLLKLQEKKEELEIIVQEAPNPILLHSIDGKVLMLNKAWVDMTGYTLEENRRVSSLIEKMFEDAKIQTSVKEHMKALYKSTGTVDDGEYTFLTKEKKKVICKFSSTLLSDKYTVITSAMNITEIKRKDEMLIAQSRLAAMGEMIGMIAHQWRQPISVISMDANNMLVDIGLDSFSVEQAEGYANDIIFQTQHLSSTIDDFRNFFKPDKESSKIKLPDVVQDTYRIIKDSLINNNIEFKSSYESEYEVYAYPRELIQVFINIITNAKDVLIMKKVEDAKIDVKVYEDEKFVNTEICDNGGGVDEEILEKIFEPYFTTKDEKTGTGLGLYMSKIIIEKHLHGTIEAFNNESGACFRVRLHKS